MKNKTKTFGGLLAALLFLTAMLAPSLAQASISGGGADVVSCDSVDAYFEYRGSSQDAIAHGSAYGYFLRSVGGNCDAQVTVTGVAFVGMADVDFTIPSAYKFTAYEEEFNVPLEDQENLGGPMSPQYPTGYSGTVTGTAECTDVAGYSWCTDTHDTSY